MQGLKFWWEKQNDTHADKTNDKAKSEVTLKVLNESLGIGNNLLNTTLILSIPSYVHVTAMLVTLLERMKLVYEINYDFSSTI